MKNNYINTKNSKFWASIVIACMVVLMFQTTWAHETTAQFNQAACGGLAQEAEQAQLFGNLAIGNGEGSSGGAYIHVPNNISSNGSLDRNNRADFCVTISVEGEYQIKGWVTSPDHESDSYFVQLDGAPAAGYLWDTRKGGQFIEDLINDRGKTDPQIFYMTAGQHTMSFVHRESGTKLDRIELVLVSASGNQPATPTNVAPTATNIPPTSTPNTNPGNGQCGPLAQEAEQGQLFGNLAIGNGEGASGGAYIHVPNNISSNGTLDWNNRADFCVTIAAEGEYQIKGWVKSSDHQSDSFFVRVDNGPTSGYLWDTRKGNSFAEDLINDRGKTDPQKIYLTAGQHTLSFIHRESGTKLDRFVVEQLSGGGNPAPTATNVPPTATNIPPTNVPPTATSVPPTATPVPNPGNGQCGSLAQEAEQAQLFGNLALGYDGAASGGAFIHVPNNISSNGSLNRSNRADFCVNIAVSGEYQIKAWVKAPDIYSDSYFVTLDNSPANGYLWDTRKGNQFAEDLINDRGKSDPQKVYLAAGEHTLSFVHRESGTQLDRFEFVLVSGGGNTNPTPTNVPPTAVAPTATAPPPTSTPVTNPGNGQCGGLSQEAESAALFGSFAVGSGGGASGGSYIYVPNSVSSKWSPDQNTRADFCVNLATAGEYQVKAWVKAPDNNSDSFYVMVDGSPANAYLWDTRQGNQFAEDLINDRGKSDPQKLTLSAGEHTLSVMQRESGTQLDRIEFVLLSGNGAPLPSPTSQPPAATATPPSAPTATPISGGSGSVYYVSRNGNNGDGRSWGSAWNELNRINWGVVRPGDTIFIDGGSNGMTYQTTLKPTTSGDNNNPILVQLSSEGGRNGKAIFFGGNNVLLPECGQRSWDESQLNRAGENGILFEKGVSNIIVDGRKRHGIVIHGWKADGVKFQSDRINNGRDDNTKNITLRYMEIYNNGGIRRQNDGNVQNLYYPNHANSGIELSGVGHVFQFMEIHDNSGDAIQSGYTNPSGGVYNNMDDLTLTDSWLYNMRAHSGRDNSPAGEQCTLSNQSGCDELGAPHMAKDYQYYPSFPANRVESFNWCTHSDGIQIYSSNDFNKMTVQRSIIGPNFMTGMILGDRNSSNNTAWVNDLTLEDVVITRFMHNALGMKNPSNNAGKNWKLKNVTIYGHYNNTNKGTLNLDSNANYDEHSIENTVMMYGRTSFPRGNVRFSNNCEYAMYSGTIGGTKVDPQFQSIIGRDVFENNINADFANVFTDNYSVGASQCAGKGSGIKSARDLINRFNKN